MSVNMNKQTIVIRTAQTSSPNSGRAQVIAKANGKQRTVSIDPAYSPDQNHAAAAGALLNVLCDERQKSMLRHPSGKSRVRVERTSDAGGHRRFTINV